MPIEAELHDGRILEFPDNTPPEVIQRTVKAQLAAGGGQKSPPSALEDVAKSAAFNGVPSGLAGILGFPADIVNLAGSAGKTAGSFAGEKLRQLAGKPPLTPERKAELDNVGLFPSRIPLGSPDINSAIQSVTGQYYQPQTTAGKYARTATEFATGGLPAGKLGVLTSGVGGLTSEGAGQAFEGTRFEPYARIIGGIAGTTTAGLPLALRDTPSNMIAKRTKNLTQAEWDAAEALQKQANEVGVPLTGAEALDSRSLQSLASDVTASAGGGETMGKFFDARNSAVKRVVGGQLDNIGEAVNPSDVASRAVGAGEKVIKQAEGFRTAETSPFYQAARQQKVPQGEVDAIISKIDEAIASSPQGTALERELKSFKTSLLQRATDEPVTNIGTLDSARKTFRDRTKLPDMNANAIDKETAANINPILDDLRNTLTRNSPDFAQGRALHEQMSPPIEALKAGEVGQLSRAKTLDTVIKTFTDPNTARPGTIRDTMSKIATADKTLPRDIARTYLENTFNGAAKDIQSGSNRMIGVNFRNSIMGTPQQKQNMKALLQEAAKAQGLPENDIWNGFNRTMDVLERTGRIPGVGSPTSTRAESNAEAASGGFLNSTVGNLNPTGGGIGATIRSWWRDTVQTKNYQKLADILTDPNSVAKMRQLAQLSPNSPRARLLVANILGITRESQKQPPQK